MINSNYMEYLTGPSVRSQTVNIQQPKDETKKLIRVSGIVAAVCAVAAVAILLISAGTVELGFGLLLFAGLIVTVVFGLIATIVFVGAIGAYLSQRNAMDGLDLDSEEWTKIQD